MIFIIARISSLLSPWTSLLQGEGLELKLFKRLFGLFPFVFFFRRKNNRATAEHALARLKDLLELKEFNQDADEVSFSFSFPSFLPPFLPNLYTNIYNYTNTYQSPTSPCRIITWSFLTGAYSDLLIISLTGSKKISRNLFAILSTGGTKPCFSQSFWTFWTLYYA